MTSKKFKFYQFSVDNVQMTKGFKSNYFGMENDIILCYRIAYVEFFI